jgi:cysteine-rich repeat protein
MRHRLLTRLVLALAGAGALAVPADASAQAPPPGMDMGTSFPPADAFTIRYWITNSEGVQVRTMQSQDFKQFVNKARCECGHEIIAEVRLKATMSGYNQGTQVDAMVGTSCNTAEQAPFGQFKRCAVFKSSVLSDYIKGITTGFHPVWLSNGVDPSSDDRDPATAPAVGRCDIGAGESGVWMCGWTNNIQGCQSDEFFITGTQNINVGMGGIKYDFISPLAEIQTIDGLPGDSAIVLSWTLKSVGDIAGFRVLCEEADTGQPIAGKAQSKPALTAIPNGTFFYTKDLLCPGGPFSTANISEEPSTTSTTGDGTTGDGTTGDGTSTTTDTTGGLYLEFASSGSTSDASTSDGTSGSTGTTGVEAVCGNGMAEEGEDCDDGNDVDDDGCLATCRFNISDSMRNLNWDYVCTGHIAYNTNSVRIEGLENGKNYNFLLVAYDLFGNPKAVDKIVQAAPVETYDLWEQCAADGGVCGESGFCNVGNENGGLMAVSAITMLGLGGIGVARRRRNRA